MDPVIQFPHAVISNIAVTALSTLNEDDVVIPVDIDPPQLEEAETQGDGMQASTSTKITSQRPVTEVSAVSKPKGRAAKRAHHHEEINSAISTNTAVTYLDLATEEPVSKKGNTYRAYLLKAAPTTLGIEELRKHGIISDIEKNRALTRMANAITKLAPHLQHFLRKLDPTLNDQQDDTDHGYHATQDT